MNSIFNDQQQTTLNATMNKMQHSFDDHLQMDNFPKMTHSLNKQFSPLDNVVSAWSPPSLNESPHPISAPSATSLPPPSFDHHHHHHLTDAEYYDQNMTFLTQLQLLTNLQNNNFEMTNTNFLTSSCGNNNNNGNFMTSATDYYNNLLESMKFISIMQETYNQNTQQNYYYYNHRENTQKKFILPSGPRRSDEGIREIEQGIVSAVEKDNCFVLEVTLLVSGFIIGPGGSSIRDIQKISGCDIQSWTQQMSTEKTKKIRIFVLEGKKSCIANAVRIIIDAVERYKMLFEGQYFGRQVEQKQEIDGVSFYYNPPPRNAVPLAASIKTPKK